MKPSRRNRSRPPRGVAFEPFSSSHAVVPASVHLARLVTSSQSTSPLARSRCWADLLQGRANRSCHDLGSSSTCGAVLITATSPTPRFEICFLAVARSRDYDAMGPQTRFVQCPEGELQKRKEATLLASCLSNISEHRCQPCHRWCTP